MAEAEATAPGTQPVPFSALSGSIYAAVITSQLASERERRSSLEGTAGGVVRSAGTLLTLFTAALALLRGKDFHLPAPSLSLIALAYILLIAAGISAIAVGVVGNKLYSYGEIPSVVLEDWLADWKLQDPAGAARRVADVQIENLKVLRGQNVARRRIATLAVGCELAGAVALVVALASLFR